jgi:photosystem II stability/assembly factor-like uncharacterized protein
MHERKFSSGLIRVALLPLFVAGLAACGGGGSSDSPPIQGSNTPGSPISPSTPTPEQNPNTPGGTGGAVTSTRITGLSQQAAPNSNYTVASTVAGTVVVTLPASPAVGDTVRITGESANQWRVAQNANQVINTALLPNTRVTGQAWSVGDATPRNWWAVAASADGLKLVAATNGAIGSTTANPPLGNDGRIYTSTDGGASWTARPQAAGSNTWSSVASSADGTKLAAVGPGSQIWTSGDSGVTWVASEISRFWTSITMSADGSRMAAVVEEGPNGNSGVGRIYLFTPTGSSFGVGTWAPVAGAAPGARNWRSITMSDDGSRIAAVAHTDGGTPFEQVHYSTNFGATWAQSTGTTGTFANAYRIRSSADGTQLVMAEGYPATAEGRLWTSTDSGANWTRRNAASTTSYTSVDISADGSKMLAVQDGGQIYASIDSGVTWTARETNRVWRSVAMSTDGNRSVALVNGGVSYVSIANRTAAGTAGSLTGAQNNSITLTYAGGGVFDVSSSSGTFAIQ